MRVRHGHDGRQPEKTGFGNRISRSDAMHFSVNPDALAKSSLNEQDIVTIERRNIDEACQSGHNDSKSGAVDQSGKIPKSRAADIKGAS
jgi:hypothetical protein